MTDIYLFRHGQASFGAENYDKLSPMGEHQCALLGKHLANQRLSFDAIYCGPLQRQQESARICCEQHGVDSDTVTVMSAFKEYDAKDIFNAYLPGVLEDNAELRAAGEGLYKDRNLFQRALMAVMAAWIEDRPCTEKIERWSEFVGRITEALHQLVSQHGKNDKIAVHTSGGVIAVAVGHALGVSDEQKVALNWQVINSAVSRIRYGRRSGYMLAGFNGIAHLEKEYDKKLITYR
ncbi:hypothetical protein CAI21_14640 [Alkalilimnicola ehrlichii]|uniref:Histidine phosphatase family protein n=1 Tax=Alkalilimnicola ehrlichii TaxID=351052 RepID=A0A3E0WQW2_9GAMM|nr:histidine phosphatase family protein [Alkalilimnicola ehrlichii]RFA27278.1 hypothetical protein CAI21_14640 [Alkalilimnicola ehrlichii]RFA34387.1 hypothetical protein CAL65_15205 [Alkalilimnicola ehrlichii]